MLKKILSSALLVGILFSSLSVVYAYNGSFTSTYSMTGGLYTRSFMTDAGDNVKVTTTPTQGVTNANITLYLEKETSSGSTVVATAQNSSTVKDTSYLKAPSQISHHIYMRNWTGLPMKGNISVSW